MQKAGKIIANGKEEENDKTEEEKNDLEIVNQCFEWYTMITTMYIKVIT